MSAYGSPNLTAACLECGGVIPGQQVDGFVRRYQCAHHPDAPAVIRYRDTIWIGRDFSALRPVEPPAPTVQRPTIQPADNPRPRPDADPQGRRLMAVCSLCGGAARKHDGGYQVSYECRLHPWSEIVFGLIPARPADRGAPTPLPVVWLGSGWGTSPRHGQPEYIMAGDYSRRMTHSPE